MKKTAWNEEWTLIKQDKTRRKVTLPHDAMIEEERSPESPSGSAGAFFPGGFYTYEKHFSAKPGEHLEFYFEGVYRNARVFINGKEAGGAAYGYIPFSVCADDFAEEGDNLLTVTVDNTQCPNSRWYTGSGIYRPVWMYRGSQSHILRNGIKVTTLSCEPAEVRVEVLAKGGAVKVELMDGERVLASGEPGIFVLEDVQLWDENTPKLYTCRATLQKDGETLDQAETTFGIRTVTWDAKGLYVNGRSVLLKGGCVHHDNGILGARSFREAEWRRVRILKEAGFNAIRSSHNPASQEMLAACDFYGMYVIDEAWDMWYGHKSKFDYAGDFPEHYREDLQAMVEQDFNHPSVIMYSIGNEVSEPAFEKGVELAKELVSCLHELDAGRAVSGGMNLMIISQSAQGNAIYKEDGGLNENAGIPGSGGEEPGGGQKQQMPPAMDSTAFNMMAARVGAGMNYAANMPGVDEIVSPVLDALDIAGYNYASGRYPLEGELHPDRLIFGSETFPGDIAKNWEMVKKYPYLIGDFMWTAWDYLGETGIGAWSYTADGFGFDKPYPWLLADTGAFDILGNPNGELFLAQAVWEMLDAPKIAVQPVNHPGVCPAKAVWRSTNGIPSWAWSGCAGNDAVVEVYASHGACAELVLNGRSLGKARLEGCKAVFEVKYEPGILSAVIYDGEGSMVSQSSLSSAKKAAVRPVIDRESAVPGEVLFIPVEVIDEDGTIERNADESVNIQVMGGELLAFGSADPRTEGSFLLGTYGTYYGQAMAVVRAGEAGATLKLEVTGDKSGKSTAAIKIE
ncbi:MAG: DUF4982 domain-containing protein [Acetatifactor sp.]|nr:DUF4982 domain-containing protein [Acetatifactor sp.]